MSQGAGQSPSNPKPSLQDKLADSLLRGVMVGGISVGGLGAFWKLFIQSDLPQAVLSVVIGGGISYGAAMLGPIHRGNKTRFAKAGEAANRSLDRITLEVINRAQGIESKYSLCQACDCQRIKTEGKVIYEGIFTPLLKEVFVPLEVNRDIQAAGYPSRDGSITENVIRDPENLGIWRFLRKAKREPNYRSLTILAWGGYGKTTLLKHIAFVYGTKQSRAFKVSPKIPVLLVLRKYRNVIANNNRLSLADLIVKHHIPSLPGASDLRIEADWFDQKLKSGDVVVMLDGFDEVKPDQRNGVTAWINRQMKRYDQSIFILTSRPKAFRSQDPAHRLEMSTVLWVQKFQQPQRADFVRKWYDCQLRLENADSFTPDIQQESNEQSDNLLAQVEARQALKDLAQNPLLLNMIVTFHRRYPGAILPTRRVDLYDAICQLRLRDQPAAKQLDTLLINCKAQKILQGLALQMVRQEKERIEKIVAIRIITELLDKQGETVLGSQFIEDVIEISELVVEQEDELEFAHKSFKDYLTSVEISETQQETILYSHFDETDENWRDVIQLYAGHTNPTQLLQQMLKQDKKEFAFRCLQETRKRVEENVKDAFEGFEAIQKSVTDARYEALEAFLKNGQWQEADYETYRLMITAVGKETGQWFEPNELINFPYDELLAIDALWVQYSQGKFGFSVQKDLYINCGGVLDGKYHEEAWNSFAIKNGWNKNTRYEIEAPKGHLPIFCGVVGWVGGVREMSCFSSLAQRLVTFNS